MLASILHFLSVPDLDSHTLNPTIPTPPMLPSLSQFPHHPYFHPSCHKTRLVGPPDSAFFFSLANSCKQTKKLWLQNSLSHDYTSVVVVFVVVVVVVVVVWSMQAGRYQRIQHETISLLRMLERRVDPWMYMTHMTHARIITCVPNKGSC